MIEKCERSRFFRNFSPLLNPPSLLSLGLCPGWCGAEQRELHSRAGSALASLDWYRGSEYRTYTPIQFFSGALLKIIDISILLLQTEE